MMKPVDIIFDGPKCVGTPKYLSVADDGLKKNVKAGEWYERSDGFHALRVMLIGYAPDKAMLGAEETIVQIPLSRDEIALIAMKIMLTEIYGGQQPSLVSMMAREKSRGIIPKNAYALADAMLEAAQ